MTDVGPITMPSIKGENYRVDHVDGDEHKSTSQHQEKLDFENIQPAQPYAYQQEAPIEPLQTVDDIQAVANRFQTTVAKYAGDLEGQMVDRPPQPQVNFIGQSEYEKWQEQAVDWNARPDRADKIATGFNFLAEPGGAYSYMLGNEPVGLMDLDSNHEQHTEINWLVAHPGVSGAGQAMVEKAVNIAESNGHSGVVRLSTSNESRANFGFYEALGFEPISSGDNRTVFQLAPGANQNQGRWTKLDFPHF